MTTELKIADSLVRRYVTTNEWMSRFNVALVRLVPFDKAPRFVHNLFQSSRLGRYQPAFLTPDQFDREGGLRQRFSG